MPDGRPLRVRDPGLFPGEEVDGAEMTPVSAVKDVDPYRPCCRDTKSKIVKFLRSCIMPGADLLAEYIEHGYHEDFNAR
jgi:hypothetical protein